MDQIEPLKLPLNYLEAGRQYVETAQKLGLELGFAAWTCVANEEFRLVLVSDWAARFGSRQLHELLARAYLAHVLPQEISPFMVEIFTPKSSLGKALIETPTIEFVYDNPNDAEGNSPFDLRIQFGPYAWSHEWRFNVRQHSRSANDIRKFQRFQRNVDELNAA